MRDRILQALREGLEPLDHVLAFWEGGSRAMGRADPWSDLDLHVMIEDGKVDETAALAEAILAGLAPFEKRFEVPRPTWHGHWQCFWKLESTDPYLLIDLCIMQESHPDRIMEPEIHGRPVVFFDKRSITRQVPTDAAAFAERLRKRLYVLEMPAEMMHPFVDKELLRGRPVDAFSYYYGLLLNRLIEVLRMRHCPWRYNFGFRYLDRDLPAHLYQEVQSLVYVAGPEELPAKKARALEMIRATLAEIKGLDLVDLLERART